MEDRVESSAAVPHNCRTGRSSRFQIWSYAQRPCLISELVSALKPSPVDALFTVIKMDSVMIQMQNARQTVLPPEIRASTYTKYLFSFSSNVKVIFISILYIKQEIEAHGRIFTSFTALPDDLSLMLAW